MEAARQRQLAAAAELEAAAEKERQQQLQMKMLQEREAKMKELQVGGGRQLVDGCWESGGPGGPPTQQRSDRPTNQGCRCHAAAARLTGILCSCSPHRQPLMQAKEQELLRLKAQQEAEAAAAAQREAEAAAALAAAAAAEAAVKEERERQLAAAAELEAAAERERQQAAAGTVGKMTVELPGKMTADGNAAAEVGKMTLDAAAAKAAEVGKMTLDNAAAAEVGKMTLDKAAAAEVGKMTLDVSAAAAAAKPASSGEGDPLAPLENTREPAVAVLGFFAAATDAIKVGWQGCWLGACCGTGTCLLSTAACKALGTTVRLATFLATFPPRSPACAGPGGRCHLQEQRQEQRRQPGRQCQAARGRHCSSGGGPAAERLQRGWRWPAAAGRHRPHGCGGCGRRCGSGPA